MQLKIMMIQSAIGIKSNQTREAKHVRKARQYHFLILMRTVLVMRFRQPLHDSKKQQVDDGPMGSYITASMYESNHT
jgi:hypothetical protein